MYYNNDFYLITVISNFLNKINTGIIILDTLLIIILSSLIFYLNSSIVKNTIIRKIGHFLNNFNKINKIIYSSTDKDLSKRYKALLYFISKKNDPSINTMIEVINLKYNKYTEDLEENNISLYRINQSNVFNIDTNIKGKIYNYDKEKFEISGKINYIEITYLEIFSNKLSLLELENWVEQKYKDYEKYIRLKSLDKQLLLEISNNLGEKIIVFDYKFESNITFENRFFEKKDEILNKINLILNNKEWYLKRGIPYTLGFLLWGDPGCGKTGFIKALLNLTKRHGISIKLNNNFDLNKLKEIIYDDEITDNIIIPQDNRIIIIEDIDCMSDIVIDRDIINKNYKYNKKKDINIIEPINNYNNNLIFLLNILDGLHECSGRIIIITTNKPDKLDKALIRPGRIDFNIHFTKATINDIKNMLSFYWNVNILINDLDQQLNMKYSHAEIINFCRISNNITETLTFLNK